MRVQTSALASAVLPALAAAGTIPTYSGMSVVFSETFIGNSGDPIDTDVWNIATCKYAHVIVLLVLVLTILLSYRHKL